MDLFLEIVAEICYVVRSWRLAVSVMIAITGVFFVVPMIQDETLRWVLAILLCVTGIWCGRYWELKAK